VPAREESAKKKEKCKKNQKVLATIQAKEKSEVPGTSPQIMAERRVSTPDMGRESAT